MAFTRDLKPSGEFDSASPRQRDPARVVGWIAIAVVASFLIIGLCT
jgi:hypothetical protein